MRHIKVAVASKLRHAEKLKTAFRGLEGFHCNSRWIDSGNLAINAAKPASHWLVENLDDITNCDYVIGYVEEGELLKTALGEIFWGLAHQKPVILIGFHDSYEPWCHYSNQVRRVKDIDAAIVTIRQLENLNRPSIGRNVLG